MTAYYNEIDGHKAAWLRELIVRGLIASGDVDERSITDVVPADLAGYSQCHFFAGIGVWSYALRLAGWDDARPVWTGSCPCQPFSVAGRGKGPDDARHLWPEWARLIRECRPTTVFGEQVSGAAGIGWFDLVHAELEGAGYAVGAADLCAAGIGAPHVRQRLYFIASILGDAACTRGETRLSESKQREERQSEIAYDAGSRESRPGHRPTSQENFWSRCEQVHGRDGKWRPVEPGTFPLAHGAAARVVRLRGYGDAIVAPLAAAFIQASSEVIA